MGKVHKTGGDDRLEVDSGGVVTIEAGGALRAEVGAIIELPEQIESFSATAFTLSPQQAFKRIRTTSGSAVSITVPPNSDVPFLVGTQIVVKQEGAGQVTFVAGVGVTIHSPETLKIAKQYAVAMLTKDATDTWTLTGYLEAA